MSDHRISIELVYLHAINHKNSVSFLRGYCRSITLTSWGMSEHTWSHTVKIAVQIPNTRGYCIQSWEFVVLDTLGVAGTADYTGVLFRTLKKVYLQTKHQNNLAYQYATYSKLVFSVFWTCSHPLKVVESTLSHQRFISIEKLKQSIHATTSNILLLIKRLLSYYQYFKYAPGGFNAPFLSKNFFWEFRWNFLYM